MASAPEMTQEDLDVAVRLRTAVTRLNRRLRQQSLGGVSPAQASMLAMVDRLGCPTLGELARAEQVQPPTATRLVSQMEEAGLVSRTADATDRRVARVAVTTKGRKELERIRRLKTAYLVERLESLSSGDRAQAAQLVALLEVLEADR